MIQTASIGSTTSNRGRLGAPKNPLVDTVLPLPEAVQMPVSVFIVINHMRARKRPCALLDRRSNTSAVRVWIERHIIDASLLDSNATYAN